MKYLRIASKSRTNSVDMFTLGVSTARGTDKIGQFGSGSLMGTLCWIRSEGDSPIFGLNGTRIEFDCTLTKKSDGEPFRQVFMQESQPMSLAKRTPLSVSLEYGEIDWPDPMMALREWVSNAIDQGADITDGECIKMVEESEIDFPEDSVVVYVPVSGFVKKYFANLDQYFLHFTGKNKDPYIIKKKPTKCRVYRRGVFIRQMEFDSICDYNLDFSINECRNGSSDSIHSDILKFVCGRNGDLTEEYKECILSAVLSDLDCVEVRDDNWYTVYKSWDSFLKTQNFKCHDGNEAGIGYHIRTFWYNRFISCNPELDGLKSVSQAVREGFIIVENPPELDKMAKMIWEVIEMCQLANNKKMPPVECFKTKDGSMPRMMGAYDHSLRTVSIWERAINPETVLHEFGHHITGADDNTRTFTSFFTRMCIELMKLAN